MTNVGDTETEALIRAKQKEIDSLKNLLCIREAELKDLLASTSIAKEVTNNVSSKSSLGKLDEVTKLSNSAIGRYSRQMILPELRPGGQKKLLSSSVLVVGCGGE